MRNGSPTVVVVIRPRLVITVKVRTSLDIVAVEPFENEWRRILDRVP